MSVVQPTYVVVINYQRDNQRFWNGRRPVTEYPDAEEYVSFGKARAAIGKARVFLKDRAVDLVENYGLDTERVALK
jgi:hypothetical protein